MLKSLQLAVGFSLISTLMAPTLAFSRPTQISRKAPVPVSQDLPLCYMTLSGGQTMNLTGLCDRSSTASTIAVAELTVTDLKFSGNTVTGRVKNNTNKVVTAVVVNYAVAGAESGQQDRGSALLEQSTLQPQQEGTFRGDLPNPGQVKVTSVDWIPAN